MRIIAALEWRGQYKSLSRGRTSAASTAAKVFNVPLWSEIVTRAWSNADSQLWNHFTGSAPLVWVIKTDLNRTEAKLIDTYYKTYPKLRQYISDQVNFAREHGYAKPSVGPTTLFKGYPGRNAVVRGAAERNAVNAPIQGCCNIIKIAMIPSIRNWRRNFKSKMLLQVHDELVFDAYKPELESLKSFIKDQMEHAYQLTVPLEVDMGTGENCWSILKSRRMLRLNFI